MIVSDENFVKTYMQYEGSRKRIADELGMSTGGVNQRVQHYRKHGVKLPNFKRRPVRYDVKELNELIKSYK